MDTVRAYYNSSIKTEQTMAILIGIGVCLNRLATAASQVALAIATLLGIYLWWKNGKHLILNDDARKYIKVSYLFFFATLVSIVDVDNKLYVLQNFLVEGETLHYEYKMPFNFFALGLNCTKKLPRLDSNQQPTG